MIEAWHEKGWTREEMIVAINDMASTMRMIGLVFICSCGAWDRTVAHMTGTAEICYDGVVYIQFTSGASVKYQKDGHVVLCK